MVSVGEIEKVRENIQRKIDRLKILNDDYKRAIDLCDPSGISSRAYLIARQEDQLDSDKDHLTIRQEEEISDLKRQYAIQFRRLNIENVCECNPKRI